MSHDESRLPKWARERLDMLRGEVERLRSLESAHVVLQGREWFTLFDAKEPFVLHRLFRDQSAAMCTIGVGDVLLVGRAKNKGDQE